jgi:hypothetical protein
VRSESGHEPQTVGNCGLTTPLQSRTRRQSTCKYSESVSSSMWSVGAPYAAGSLDGLVVASVAVPRSPNPVLEGVEVSVGAWGVDEGLVTAGDSG